MSGRQIAQVVSATQSGPISRLIGTVDVDGQGTQHPLEQVDPFMLLDYGCIPKSDMPPFGAHPHRGHSVVTVLTQGQVKSWDSFHDKDTVIEGPASYWVDAGSGLFHDETSVVPDANDSKQHVKLFQLWMSIKEEDRLKAPSLQYDVNLPSVESKDAGGNVVGTIRYHVGGAGASIKTLHPIVVAYVSQKPGTTLEFPIEPSHGGFVVHVLGDNVTYGGTSTPKQPNDVIVLSDAAADDESSSFLQVTTMSESAAEYLVCVGEKIQEPWYKKLVASGAVIAKTVEEAQEIATKVQEYAKKGKATGDFAPFGAAVPADK